MWRRTRGGQEVVEPDRLPMDEMEYTTIPELMEKHKGKWESVKQAATRRTRVGSRPGKARRPSGSVPPGDFANP